MPTPSFTFPLLVADIGGTNARFARVEAPGAPLGPVARIATAAHPGPAAAVRALFGDGAVRSAILCGAGPVIGQRCHLTNADWTIDGGALAAELGLATGLLLNDFEALALSLPALGPRDVLPIGSWATDGGPQLVVGPGTGLGVGALVTVGGVAYPLPSEGGHVGLSAPSPEAAAILSRLPPGLGRLTAEVVLSGPGLARLHAARLAHAGMTPDPARDGVAIVEGALADPAGADGQTVALFLTLLASYAGDMAIAFRATGGVSLAGGILPRIATLISATAFRDAFAAKAPVSALAERIGTRLITSPDAVLVGMAALAADPGRYGLDYPARLWR